MRIPAAAYNGFFRIAGGCRSGRNHLFVKGAPLAIVVLGDTTKSDLWRENAAISATILQLACVDEGQG